MEPVAKNNALPENSDDNMSAIEIGRLLDNAKAAVFGAIELHNKPIFPCRYEVSVVLTINAWECLLKAYIKKFHPEKNMHNKDGFALPFPDCITFIWSNLGGDFSLAKESIEHLYKYRCDIIHYYCEGIEVILYTLLRPNIILFSEFLIKYFGIDLGNETNLIILPLGFRRFFTPIDFISNKSMENDSPSKEFINGLINSMERLNEQGVDDGLLCHYGMFLEKENNPKHADLIIAFTKDAKDADFTLNKVTKIGGFTNEKNAPKVQIEEVDVWDIFNIPHAQFMDAAKKNIAGFKETRENMKIVSDKIKSDPNCFRVRLLDPSKPNGSRKGFYSKAGINKITNEFNRSN